MAAPSFPAEPNARTIMGEPSTESECGKFRLLDIAGSGIYAHHRRTKKAPWRGIPGQPFGSRESAERACREVAARGPGKRKRRCAAASYPS
jgi:hypothetical protein